MDTAPHGPNRRTFLGAAAGAAAAAGVLAALGEPAAGAAPASASSGASGKHRTGTLADVEHVVILMQENRSFDHYYGTMRGVRGLNDPVPLRLPSGTDVFHQPDLLRPDGRYLLPFHVDTTRVDGQDLADLDHSWAGTHAAWDQGHYDGWVAAKSELTMSYFTRADIPFHRALASAFTVCDGYFCSIQGPTTPNRLFHWTGMIDPNGRAGGPAISNPADYEPVYSWTTYPERLEAAGVSWQVYANDEVGDGSDGFVGDYGDNPLWLFQAYHDALASSDPKVRRLAERASLRTQWKDDSGLGKNVDHVLAQFESDCEAGTLPQVSWIVAPYGYSEHPQARPVDGAAYVSHVLKALWGNEELRSNTVLLLNYDENDGFFDHIVPPAPPAGTVDEFVDGLPVGLGPRVPMTVISPWSRGGWVNSQVFDHTSVIRFLEQWTGVREPNISAWRRELCGDLLSCFDFTTFDNSIPTLPDADALRRQADRTASKLPTPTPPAIGRQVTPTIEQGRAPARPLPYQPVANVKTAADGLSLALTLANYGAVAVSLAQYSYHLPGVPVTWFDVAPSERQVSTVVTLGGRYDLAVHGPNGFLRTARGDLTASATGIDAELVITGDSRNPLASLRLSNRGNRPARFVAAGRHYSVPAGHTEAIAVGTTYGWYDVTVSAPLHPAFGRRFAGHLENGRASRTG